MQRYAMFRCSLEQNDDGEWVKASDAEAALAERDARIKELEAALWEWLKVRLQPDSEVLRLVGISLKALEARDE